MIGVKQIAAIARRAAEIIQVRGKTKHELYDSATGRVCAIGALRLAMAEQDLGWRFNPLRGVDAGGLSRPDAARCEEMIVESFQRKMRQISNLPRPMTVPEWNDATLPGNSAEDIAKAYLQVADEIEVCE